MRIWLRNFFVCLLSFSGYACADNSLSGQTLRIGFDYSALPDIPRADIEVSLQFWAEEISQQAQIPIKISIYHQDTKALLSDFKQGKTNFLFTAPVNFLALGDQNLLANGFTAAKWHGYFDTLMLLTRKDLAVSSMKGLQGKRVSLLKHDAFHSMYLETICFKAFSGPCAEHLVFTEPGKNSHRLILDLYFAKTDLILVNMEAFNLAVELNPHLGNSLKILHSIAHVPMSTGYFHINAPVAFREKVIDEALKLDTFPRGKQVLELFMADKVERTRLDDLEIVREVEQEYQSYLSGR